jgi:steroid 5-alpha reductase family enzyme
MDFDGAVNEEIWFLFRAILGSAIVLMLIAWLAARRVNNAGIMDIAWALGFSMAAAICLALGSGAFERKALIAGMVGGWSLRLGIYLSMRLARRRPEEDRRYAALRAQFPRNTWLMFLGLFELQAVLLAVLSVPLIVASVNPAAGLGIFEWCGFGLWLAAVIGETVADRQLSRFTADPTNRGRVCETGLWRTSRHPNYFFESLVWVALFVFALGSPNGWMTVYCPALMLYFLIRVTGIPVTEACAGQLLGSGYRAYQRGTNAFVPWFPKRAQTRSTS